FTEFQLMHAHAAFQADRIAWRAVIYLNLVRSVRRILDTISPESDQLDDPDDHEGEPASIIISARGRPASALSGTRVAKYEQYRQRLEPLKNLEARLIRMLSSPDDDEDEPTQVTPKQPNWSAYATGNYNRVAIGKNGRPSPVISIPPPRSFESPISPLSPSTSHGLPSPGGSSNSSSQSKHTEVTSPKSAHTNEIEGWWDDPTDPVHVLNSCAPAMLALWKDPSVKQRLREKRLRLEESSGL
ncbi:hypothetical protein BV22DRAFT_1016602, partial [Leucogyrophana mollusca]